MKDKNTFAEILVSVVLVVLLIVFLSQSPLLMPMSTTTMMGILVALSFIVFAGLIWKEKARDERENIHVLGAGRISFVAGLLIALTGILIQSFNHNIDPWLIFTAIGMILAKIFFRIYSSRNN